MRKGQNPAKFVNQVAQPERVTVAVLNYIPFLSGFYADMLNVLETCLGSIWENTDLPYDLMVFDNGSCEEVCQYLVDQQAEGRIQYLIQSEKNLGKGGAWNVIFGAAPGEVLAYTDNDALFSKGWLSHSLRILETYPRVGMVTSRPFRTRPEYYARTLEWARNTPAAQVEEGQLVPWETFKEFDLSLGQTEEEIRQHYQSSQDVRLTYQGVPAFAGASHWQFVGYKSTLNQFLPFKMDRPMGQVKKLDEMVNEAGYLRLMTAEPLAMNMSNTLENVPGVSQRAQPAHRSAGKRFGLLDLPPVKKALLGLYNRIFNWYYAG